MLAQSPDNTSSSLPSICIVTHTRGAKYARIHDYVASNKQSFCDACGYRCMISRGMLAEGRPPAWDKIIAVQKALDVCETVVWADADATFLWPFQLPPVATPIAAMKDKNGLNTGMMILKRSASTAALLGRAWNATQFIDHTTWEQAAIRHVLAQDASLRAETTLLSGLVSATRHGPQPAFPVFHAAGCLVHGKKPMRSAKRLS
jgi:hypothetical protein